LSGGEAQRIQLATNLGSLLVGTLYVLDEPSIGLHPRDNARLISILENLRDIGNTLLVVEHDEDTMRAADHILDIGLFAGELGGNVVSSKGDFESLLKDKASLTARYLRGDNEIKIPQKRRPKGKKKITITGAREHNPSKYLGRYTARDARLRSPACPAQASRLSFTTCCTQV
jgi:excinuclease ABC subunit A